MPKYPEVTLPIIHLNGDRKETLVGNLERAYDAAHEALDALKQCSPNMRNYYPAPGSFQRAIVQHDARLAALSQLMLSLEAEAIGIQEQP